MIYKYLDIDTKIKYRVAQYECIDDVYSFIGYKTQIGYIRTIKINLDRKIEYSVTSKIDGYNFSTVLHSNILETLRD